MVAKTNDAYLEAGMIGLMINHPITGKPTESLLPMGNYPQNQPGVKQFALDMEAGSLSEVHGELSTEELALIVFAKLAEAKGDDYVITALSKVDKAVEAAQAAKKVESWREKLAGMVETQTQAAALFASRKSLREQLEAVEAQIAEAQAEVAQELDISGLFDLSLISTGWYVSEGTKTKGSREIVKRDYTANLYSCSAGKKINDVPIAATAEVTSRDDDGNPNGWKVVYTAKGKKYAATGETLNATDQEARAACMAVIAEPGAATNNNCPKFYNVPKLAVKAS